MPKWLLPMLAAGALHAATIRGAVVEEQGGKPLSRALVTAQPVAGTAGLAVSARTNVYGAFELANVPPGAYLVTASRRSFAPVQYGQKRWKSAGVPVIAAEGQPAVLNFRLPRFGAITGAVVDENDVGIPEHEVMAYRNTRPPQVAAKAVTDDRGMFRLWGLEPGAYLVRTGARRLDDENYLPTFSHETLSVDQAFLVDVSLDQSSDAVTVRPFLGPLCTVTGQVSIYPRAPVTVTLSSDMGSQTISSNSTGRFQFTPVTPGRYELTAVTQPGRGSVQAAYMPLTVDRDVEVRPRLGPLPDLEVLFEDTQGQPMDNPVLFRLMGRRKELSGDAAVQPLALKEGRVPILLGRWDLALMPMAPYYVAGFSPRTASGERGPAGGWNEVAVPGDKLTVKFVLSASPGAIHGTVTNGGDRAAGAPVYLEPYSPAARARIGDLRTARADLQGNYQFFGLGPGSYRILSTFEFQAPDSAAMEASGAQLIQVEEARDIAQDLRLYILP